MLDATRNLLDALDPLSHRARTAHLVDWARTAADRPAVCADLRARGTYERQLALLAAIVVADRDGIEAAVADPRPAIRGLALGAALRAGLLPGRFHDLPAADRRRLYRTLRRLRRPDLADALMAEVRAHRGDLEAATLLPECGPATVRALLPDLEDLADPARLAARHPDVLLDRVAERLAAADPEDRRRIWGLVGAAVLRCDPGRALDLLERYAPDDRLPGALTAYGVLAAHDPDRVARLLTAAGRAAAVRRERRWPAALLRRLAALPDERLLPLARLLRDRARAFAALLETVPPARRGEVYDAALADVDTTDLIVDGFVMAALPATIRHREAARILALPDIRRQPASVAYWSSYLPWPQASAAIEPGLRSGTVDERATAYRLLLAAARRTRDPAVTAGVVNRLGRLRNEPDPVRSAVLSSLDRPVPGFTAASVPALTRIVADTLGARDASADTIRRLTRLAASTLRDNADDGALREWALTTIELVCADGRAPELHRLHQVLRPGQEVLVVERLGRWIESAIERGRYEPLFTVAEGLGRRAWRVPRLQELLRRAAGPTTSPAVARTAAELWLAGPRTRGVRVAEVLANDPTAVAVPVVWRTVCRHRTDLLDRVLEPNPRGRFLAEDAHWIPARPETADRWLPRQQAAFAAHLETLIADSHLPARVRVEALKSAARAGGPGRELVRRYRKSPEVVLAEGALGALPWTDRPGEALAELLAEAGGDRARVALYAAARAAAFVPPSRLPTLLDSVLLGRPLSGGPQSDGPQSDEPQSDEPQSDEPQSDEPQSDEAEPDQTQPDQTQPDQTQPDQTQPAGSLSGAPPSGGPLLGPAKVTSRKSAAHLLAAFGPPAALGTLLDAYAEPGTHRDVRAAIVAAARQRLDLEPSWTILGRAARGSLAECRALVTADHRVLPAGRRPRYAALIAEACRSADPDIRGLAFSHLPGWAPWLSGAADLIVERLADEEELPLAFAAQLLDAMHRAEPGSAALGDLLVRLADRDAADDPDGTRVDRPGRRRVHLLARGAVRLARTGASPAARSGLAAAFRRLAGRIEFTAAVATTLAGLGRLDNLDEIADLCTGRPVLAVRAAARVAERVADLPELHDPAYLHGVVRRLAGRGDLAGGLFAVELVRPGGRFRWSGPWRDLLAGLRSHPDADVREEAYAITTG